MAFNFDEFLRRLEALKGMGSIEEILAQVPGLAAILKDVEFRLADLEPIEQILRAMSPEERLEPDLLEGPKGLPRRMRIASAARTTLEAVEGLIEQFRKIQRKLETMSADELTHELVQEMQPRLEDWQRSPDAWKNSEEEEAPEAQLLPVNDVEEEDEEEDEDPEARAAAERAAFDERLDEVLRKLGRSGMNALTPEERAFLDQASRRLRTERSRG